MSGLPSVGSQRKRKASNLYVLAFVSIVTSPKLRRYLRGEVAPDLVVIDQTKVAAFEEQLRWAGLQVAGELSVKVHKG